jgi:probable phosphoglycerate mutase
MQPFPGRGLFFLLRHGETEWNRERRVMGRRPVPLSEHGRRQLCALLPHLEDLGIRTVWTSPLERARGTAELVARHLGDIEVKEDPGLTEVDYAGWEGKTFQGLLEDPEYHAFHRDPVATPIPGGGESLLAVRERVFAAMERIARDSRGAPVVVVSHGDPLRLILAACLGMETREFRRLRVDNGALSAVELTGDWAEVKFVNMRPDLGAMIGAEKEGARAVREMRGQACGADSISTEEDATTQHATSETTRSCLVEEEERRDEFVGCTRRIGS